MSAILFRNVYLFLIQTALHIYGQPVFPPWLSGHDACAPEPQRRHLVGRHDRVQQRADLRLLSLPAAAGNQRPPAARLFGWLSQAAQVTPTKHGRPLEVVVSMHYCCLFDIGQTEWECWCSVALVCSQEATSRPASDKRAPPSWQGRQALNNTFYLSFYLSHST